MEKRNLLFEDPSKKIWDTADPTLLVQEFKNLIKAVDNTQHDAEVPSRGACNNNVSIQAFEFLHKQGVPTHFHKKLSENEMLVHRLRGYPLRIYARNIAADKFAKRIQAAEGEIIPLALVEFRFDIKKSRSPLVDTDQLTITEGDVKLLQFKAIEINKLLQSFFEARNLTLVDCAMEFGRDANGRILLGGEVSPDTCRLWDKSTHEKLDKDRFRRDLGGVEEAYREVLRRVAGGPGGQ